MSRWTLTAVLATGAIGVYADVAAGKCEKDPRCNSLRNLFQKYRSPLTGLSWSFIAAADRHSIDWRLLPSIAMVESGGGKYGSKTNVFGWKSGRARFASVEAGISYVASRLAESPIYAGKTTSGKIESYNLGKKVFREKIVGYMKELSPEPVE